MTIRYILITEEGIKGNPEPPPIAPNPDDMGQWTFYETALQKWKDDCVLFEDQEKAKVHFLIGTAAPITGTILEIPPMECEVVEQMRIAGPNRLPWIDKPLPDRGKQASMEYRKVLRIKP